MGKKYNSQLSNKLIFLKHKQFTGKVSVRDSIGIEWVLYLYLGRLFWAEGGIHSHRAWRRLIDKYCPEVKKYNLTIDTNQEFKCGDYYILIVLLQNKFIDNEKAEKFIKNRAYDVVFDMLQSESKQPLQITSEAITNFASLTSELQKPIASIAIDSILIEAEQAWVIWLEKGLQNFSPNLAPQIKEPEKLREEVSGVVFQNFLRLLDGKRSLRDLAFRMNKDVRRLTLSLLPYIGQNFLEFSEIKDIQLSYIEISSSVSQKETLLSDKPLIICIDDSPQICNIMQQIIAKAGYRFFGVQQGLQAIPNLIAKKPDLVFLDIGMPIVNGYEICSQIRKISQIKHIPVVILTGNDGLVDRVRAKVVGANAFVSKPIEIEKIIQAIEENIKTEVLV